MNTLVWYNATLQKFEFGKKEDYFLRKNQNNIVFQYMLIGKQNTDRGNVLIEELEKGVVPA